MIPVTEAPGIAHALHFIAAVCVTVKVLGLVQAAKAAGLASRQKKTVAKKIIRRHGKS